LRLGLELGRFELSVQKLVTGQRFLLSLPDGELEVHGTRFVVELEGDRTRRVSVSEGRVALRLNGRAELSLGAGEHFRLEFPAAPPDGPSTLPTAPSTSEKPRPVTSTARRSSAPLGSAAPSTTVSTGSDFGLAMKAFGDGDYGRAEQLFLDFERRHPSDARVEDATFLRAVARSRRGDGDGARRIAEVYLERYPNGLRRLEAERLAR
jgi:TolA-binding protein